MESIHQSVLLNETINALNLQNGSVVLDATFGGGGHSVEICKRFKKIKIIAIDQDKSTWSKARSKFEGLDCEIYFHNVNFRDLAKVLKEEGIEKVDGVILDLGLSSDQLENSGRGFTFMKDEPLLMTMKENPSMEDLTAKDIVNKWDEKNLADIIYGYGEERFSRRIAKSIVEARKKKIIETTFELVKIISDGVPAVYRKGRLHFATRTFQALRIATNDELQTLSIGLVKGFEILKNEGRIAVISFHSLEDRIVKEFFKKKKAENEAILISKKPIIENKEELIKNNRARSAKLRILQKLSI
jgi:16S rRNA (cytosine1402-N4)-methyltransferase